MIIPWAPRAMLAHQLRVDVDRLAAARGAGDELDVGAVGRVEEIDALKRPARDRVADRYPALRGGRGREQRDRVGDVSRGVAARRAETIDAERQAADEALLPDEAPAIHPRVGGPLHLARDQLTLVVEEVDTIGRGAL